jgi:maltooligosyltrehalose trehalohydrolase
MLFMGEEYGDRAPFQFFTDHIDPEIATATREGRRREFSAFTEFAGEEVPDPQAVETFERSKLTRERDERIAALYREALALRRELPPGDADVAYDEEAGWLAVRRGDHELVCNFAAAPAEVPTGGARVVLAAGEAEVRDGVVALGARAGAVLR